MAWDTVNGMWQIMTQCLLSSGWEPGLCDHSVQLSFVLVEVEDL